MIEETGREVGFRATGAAVQRADAARAEQGEQRGREELGAGTVRGCLHHEHLVVVRHPPQLGPGRVDQPVVRDQPLFVEGRAQHPYRLRAGAGGAREPLGAARAPRKLSDRRAQGTGPRGLEQGLPIGPLGLQQGVPAGFQGCRVGARRPPSAEPRRCDGPRHEVRQRRSVVVRHAGHRTTIRRQAAGDSGFTWRPESP